MKQYDTIVIEFGKGGKPLATELTNRNWEAVTTERSSQMHGGTCINAGCIPTKTLIHESEQTERLYRGNYDSQAKFYTSVVGRENKLVSFLQDKNREHLESYPNITLYGGEAFFMSNDIVKVAYNGKKILLRGKEIFINTGSIPTLPDVEGLNESKHAFTSETLFRQGVLSKHLLILGAGTIGMEFATMYAGFGGKVTLLKSGNRFMPESNRDIAESTLETLEREDIEVRLNVHALSMYDTTNGMTLTYTDNSGSAPHFPEEGTLLLAIGRGAMTDGLNLYAASVQTDIQGAIVINGHLQITSPHIWVMGDVRGDAIYNHLSTDDFRIITNHLFGNKKRNMDDRLPVPYVIFTDPPLAHIGATREKAVKCDYSIQVSRLPATAVLRTRILQRIDGVLKAIVNAHTGHIMGCTLLCIDTPEIINLVALAMKDDLHYSVLRDLTFTYPDVSEGLDNPFKAFQHLVLGG